MKTEEEKNMSAKDIYVEKRKTEIDNWNAELDSLEAEIAAAGADAEAKIKHKEHVAVLRRKRDEARVKLAEIQAAADDKWESFKDGVEKIWIGVKGDFEKVKAKF